MAMLVALSCVAGDWVLVHAAAGGTGQLLTQICNHLGAQVIGTTSTPDKAQVAKRCGAQEVCTCASGRAVVHAL
jgi:NADPH:quinone reductase-like Zn-dependent oxidoreductase